MENQLINELQKDGEAYIQTCITVGKLHIVGGLSRILGRFLLLLTVILLVFAVSAFCAVAAISGLALCMPLWAAALIIGAFYLILTGVAIVLRKQLFINPFVALLSSVIFAEEGRKIEEERLRKEAEDD